jgi:hypothetical protein
MNRAFFIVYPPETLSLEFNAWCATIVYRIGEPNISPGFLLLFFSYRSEGCPPAAMMD